MPKLVRPQPRQGSVLATSISLVAVFLTLVVGGMAYVQSAQNSARTERLRTSAEEAARSGMELVLGWAEATLDRETKLPKGWDQMTDGQVIEPVTQILSGVDVEGGASALKDVAATKKTADGTAVVSNIGAGRILGTKLHEFVVGVQGPFVTTFKARIQQFKISDNMPRQYRIGVIGRVRKVQGGSRAYLNEVDKYERDSIVAERMVVTYLGKQASSQYASLVDIDGVKNWVPGELVTGPVHINRGYIDEPFKIGAAPNAMNTYDLPTTSTQDFGGTQYKDLRSQMAFYIHGKAGNVGFQTPNPGPPAPGDARHPVFESQVTYTEMSGDGVYGGDDSTADGSTPEAIKVNGKAWVNGTATNGDNPASFHKAMFLDPENGNIKRFGDSATAGTKLYGPKPIPQRIELPRSIRNGLAASMGMTSGDRQTWGRWRNLPDGLYIPTTRFWYAADPADAAETGTMPNNCYAWNTTTGAKYATPTGGIYIRGNVEIMRMACGGTGVYQHCSAYIFQLGNCVPADRRPYIVVADRKNKRMVLKAWPKGNNIEFLTGTAGGKTFDQVMTAAGIGDPASWPAEGSALDPAAFATSGTGNGITAYFQSPENSEFPFNGVVYVDCSKDDPARPNASGTFTDATVNSWKSMAYSGNIYSLGNPGAPTNPNDKTYAKIASGSNIEDLADRVATYTGAGTANWHRNPASRLNIMARGNIFIQNHIMVDSVVRSLGTGRDSLKGVRIQDAGFDLVGLVADKQIVVGLAAPSTTVRNNAGVVIMAAIMGLGDPAYRPWAQTIDTAYLQTPMSYVGSFTTEGLMQAYNKAENYYVLKPGGSFIAAGADADADTTNRHNPVNGYPGTPFYGYYHPTAAINNLTTGNPNYAVRGRMVVFGSITQKKRGIVGQGNNSYDKDFVFDRRMLTLGPPYFPTSTNIIIRTQTPFSPDDADPKRKLRYISGTSAPTAAAGDPDDLGFMAVVP